MTPRQQISGYLASGLLMSQFFHYLYLLDSSHTAHYLYLPDSLSESKQPNIRPPKPRPPSPEPMRASRWKDGASPSRSLTLARTGNAVRAAELSSRGERMAARPSIERKRIGTRSQRIAVRKAITPLMADKNPGIW